MEDHIVHTGVGTACILFRSPETVFEVVDVHAEDDHVMPDHWVVILGRESEQSV